MTHPQHLSRTASDRRTPIVFLLVALLSVLGVLGSRGQANALSGMVVTIASHSSYGGTPVIESGATVALNVQLDQGVRAGTTTEVSFTGGLSLMDGPIPVTCDLIQAAWIEGGVLKVTTKPTYAGTSTNQCAFGISATMETVNKSGIREVGWTLGGQNHPTTIIVKKPGDEFAPDPSAESSSSKSGRFDLDTWNKISIKDGKVILDPAFKGATISYTATVTSNDGFTGAISDSLEAPLSFVANSFRAKLTTWDSNGLNAQTGDYAFPSQVTVSGQKASIPVAIPARSRLTVTYQATIADDAALAALQARFQAEYERVKANGGWFSVNIGNTITLPGEGPKGSDLKASASTGVGGANAPGTEQPPTPPDYNPNAAFSKNGGPTPNRIDEKPVGPDQTLVVPVPVTYTLTADLTKLVERATAEHPLPLTQNVIIEDVLPVNTEWLADDPGFLSAVGMSLTRVSGVECSPSAMRSDAYRGTYCVEGRSFAANIGKDPSTNVSLTLKARIVNVKDLWENKGHWTYQGTGLDSSYWTVKNEAKYFYEDRTETRSKDIEVIRAPKNDGQKQNWVFEKVSPAAVSATPGQPVEVPYSFHLTAKEVALIGQEKGGLGFKDLVITDRFDATVFDMTRRAEILGSLIGSDAYNDGSSFRLGPSDFDASIAEDGTLTLKMGDSGLKKIAEYHVVRVKISLKAWTIPLPAAKTSFVITNYARLTGTDSTPYNWSETKTTVDSYSAEVSVDKFVRDRIGGQWVKSVRAELNDDKTPKDPYAVYRLEIAAHQTFNFAILPIIDVLDPRVEFVGFVDDAAVDSSSPYSSPTMNIFLNSGVLVADYDEGSRRVSIRQQSGVLSAADGMRVVNILVRFPDGTELTEDQPILNTVGSSTATITPGNDYPLTIRKVDASAPGTVISDPHARFVIKDGTGPDALVLAGGDAEHPVFVEKGFLRTTNAAGQTINVTVKKPGTYYVYEVKAPTGYRLSTTPIPVTVESTGASEEVAFENTPGDEPEPETTVITIVKKGLHCDTDQAECVLTGAEFALYGSDPSRDGATPITDGVVLKGGGDGATFTSAELDYDSPYWLVETKAPRGHELLAAPLKFTVSKESGIQLDSATAGLASVTSTPGTGDKLILEIKDPTRVDLPAAGGSGFMPYLVLGLGLIAAGAASALSNSRIRFARRRA